MRPAWVGNALRRDHAASPLVALIAAALAVRSLRQTARSMRQAARPLRQAARPLRQAMQ
jgi:hypothetical protein